MSKKLGEKKRKSCERRRDLSSGCCGTSVSERVCTGFTICCAVKKTKRGPIKAGQDSCCTGGLMSDMRQPPDGTVVLGKTNIPSDTSRRSA